MNEKAIEALQNSNSLFAAMLHETRPEQEIEAQIIENNLALSALPPLRAREEIARIILKEMFGENEWSDVNDRIIARCYEIADAILSLPAGQEWRDISSAPKDGQTALVKADTIIASQGWKKPGDIVEIVVPSRSSTDEDGLHYRGKLL